MKAYSHVQACRELVNTSRSLVCADGNRRRLTIDDVSPDGEGGWYVSGFDADRFRYGAYLSNDLSQVRG